MLEDNKQSEKTVFMKKLKKVKNMPKSVKKILKEEIDGISDKNDMETQRKIAYLNQVFRLPWDQRVEPYWDVKYSE